jgi:hypothetical protein
MQVPPNLGNFSQPPVAPPPRQIRYAALGEGWRWYQQDLGRWVLGGLVYLLTNAVPSFGLGIVAALIFGQREAIGPADAAIARTYLPFGVGALVVVLGSIIGVFSNLVLVGLVKRGVNQIRGQLGELGEIINFDGASGQVITIQACYALVMLPFQLISAYVQGQPGASASTAAALVPFGVGLLSVMIVPLVLMSSVIAVDQRLSAKEAFSKSLQFFGSHFVGLGGMYILSALAAGLGVIACGVGILFTLPVLFMTLAVIYTDFFRPGYMD